VFAWHAVPALLPPQLYLPEQEVQSAFPALVLYDTPLGQAVQLEAAAPFITKRLSTGHVGQIATGDDVGEGVVSVVSPPKPARHCPALVPPHPEELGSHVVHAAFPALVLYDTPLRQAVHPVVALPP